MAMSELVILKLITIFSSSILLIAGFLQFRWPPKKINNFYGYRTPRTMRNIDTWREGNHFASKLMMRLGAYHLLGALFLALTPYSEPLVHVGYILLILPLVIAMMVISERHMANVFNKDGSRR
jgi:uncharacterized membrane protein